MVRRKLVVVYQWSSFVSTAVVLSGLGSSHGRFPASGGSLCQCQITWVCHDTVDVKLKLSRPNDVVNLGYALRGVRSDTEVYVLQQWQQVLVLSKQQQ